jgi:hypothetical protein
MNEKSITLQLGNLNGNEGLGFLDAQGVAERFREITGRVLCQIEGLSSSDLVCLAVEYAQTYLLGSASLERDVWIIRGVNNDGFSGKSIHTVALVPTMESIKKYQVQDWNSEMELYQLLPFASENIIQITDSRGVDVPSKLITIREFSKLPLALAFRNFSNEYFMTLTSLSGAKESLFDSIESMGFDPISLDRLATRFLSLSTEL